MDLNVLFGGGFMREHKDYVINDINWNKIREGKFYLMVEIGFRPGCSDGDKPLLIVEEKKDD